MILHALRMPCATAAAAAARLPVQVNKLSSLCTAQIYADYDGKKQVRPTTVSSSVGFL